MSIVLVSWGRVGIISSTAATVLHKLRRRHKLPALPKRRRRPPIRICNSPPPGVHFRTLLSRPCPSRSLATTERPRTPFGGSRVSRIPSQHPPVHQRIRQHGPPR